MTNSLDEEITQQNPRPDFPQEEEVNKGKDQKDNGETQKQEEGKGKSETTEPSGKSDKTDDGNEKKLSLLINLILLLIIL